VWALDITNVTTIVVHDETHSLPYCLGMLNVMVTIKLKYKRTIEYDGESSI